MVKMMMGTITEIGPTLELACSRQGDVLGAILFCIAIHPILLRAQARFRTVKIMATWMA